MPVLRVDRLEALTTELAAGVDELDVLAQLPPEWAAPMKILRRFGFDLPARAKVEVLSSLRALPSHARSDPARADRIAAWLVHVLAWLTDQTDSPPPPPPPELVNPASIVRRESVAAIE